MKRVIRSRYVTALLLAAALAPVAARADETPTPRPPAPKETPKKAPTAATRPPDPQPAPAIAAKPAEAKPAPPARPEPPVPPKPAPQNDQLKFLVGSFACDVTRFATAGEPEKKLKAKFTGKWDQAGFFVGFQFGETKSKELPAPQTMAGFFGFDVGLKRFVFGADGSGGQAFLLRAEPPIAGVDQFVFKGTSTAMPGRHVPVLYTLTHAVKGFELAGEAVDPDTSESVKQVQFVCIQTGK